MGGRDEVAVAIKRPSENPSLPHPNIVITFRRFRCNRITSRADFPSESDADNKNKGRLNISDGLCVWQGNPLMVDAQHFRRMAEDFLGQIGIVVEFDPVARHQIF